MEDEWRYNLGDDDDWEGEDKDEEGDEGEDEDDENNADGGMQGGAEEDIELKEELEPEESGRDGAAHQEEQVR